jgi:hypothetical protein
VTAVDRTPKPCLHKRVNHQHGTRLAYILDRCRCLPCAAANSTYELRRTRLKAYGRGTPSGWVDAAPVRAHVEQLCATGMGYKTVARAAGVASSSVGRLLWGRRREDGRQEPPARRISPDAARRLLAVPPPAPPQLPGGVRVDSTGTRRRLQALACLGWSLSRLADESGLDRQVLDGALRGRAVTAGHVRAVVALYERLWDQPAPATDHRSRISVARTANRARREGWAPPAAWDDDAIDDPAAVPFVVDVDEDQVDELAVEQLLDGHRMELTGATLHAAVHALAARGLQPASISERLGIDLRQAQRLRDRAEPPRRRRRSEAA